MRHGGAAREDNDDSGKTLTAACGPSSGQFPAVVRAGFAVVSVVRAVVSVSLSTCLAFNTEGDWFNATGSSVHA